MELIFIDLVPALLSWEGRERSGEPSVALDAADALEHLASHFTLVGIADAGVGAARLRMLVERENLGVYFDSVGTSAEFGPTVTPRVVRRAGARLRSGVRDVAVVTSRPVVADAMRRARIAVVTTTHDDFGTVDQAVEAMAAGRVSP